MTWFARLSRLIETRHGVVFLNPDGWLSGLQPAVAAHQAALGSCAVACAVAAPGAPRRRQPCGLGWWFDVGSYFSHGERRCAIWRHPEGLTSRARTRPSAITSNVGGSPTLNRSTRSGRRAASTRTRRKVVWFARRCSREVLATGRCTRGGLRAKGRRFDSCRAHRIAETRWASLARTPRRLVARTRSRRTARCRAPRHCGPAR